MNLRMIGLAAVVAGATLLPLVASAGPASGPAPASGSAAASGNRSANSTGNGQGNGSANPAGAPSGTRPGLADDAKPGDGAESRDGVTPGSHAGTEHGGRPSGGGPADGPRAGSLSVPPPPAPSSAPRTGPSPAPGRAARCGPELASPDGVEAQTCVLTEGADTWARTYYRNVTGQELDSILTLMGPGGRTVQVRCSVTAEDEPGVCETPRERTRGAMAAYSAVAEFAAVGEDGGAPLLLRAGSNTAAASGG
ncbi:hypothetical protein [Streptomyces sp. NBC_01216]|uniref:hypothetical protein n=1 Tax=unclassified Streptomyces TaxID=2593676 RepID=UPI002E1664B1|nr:hypothetical protein OG393_15015 [Streptomyces sp. NBC_01216]